MPLKVKAQEQYQNVGKEVKRVTSTDEGNVEDPENEGGNTQNGENSNQNGGTNGGNTGGDNNGGGGGTDPSGGNMD